MSTLQPPTDNLYKFMAILGLLLWVGGAVYPWTKAYELQIQVIELTADIKRAGLDPTKADLIEVEKKIDQSRLTLTTVSSLFIFGILNMVVGGLLMHRGFAWWYTRVQKLLDQELLLRLKK